MNITYRKATKKDSKVVCNFICMFYFIPITGIEEIIDRVILCCENDKPIGMIESNRKRDKILILYVNKQYRRQKLGTLLFRKSIKMLKLDTENLVTKVTPESLPFWKSIGFKKKELLLTKRGKEIILMEYIK